MSKLTKKKLKQLKYLKANIFTRISYKTNFCNRKGNRFLLSIDLLKDDIQKDLLYVVNQNLENTYEEILKTDKPFLKMQKSGNVIFLQLINQTCKSFLMRKYGYNINLNIKKVTNDFYVKGLLRDIELLFQIPFYTFLDPKAPQFCHTYCPVYNYASESFQEALIDNLVIEIANCVAYISMVNFSFLYSFRQTIYRSKFLSLRNFERFRNNLAWQLRVKFHIQRPTDLYNSCYQIYVLRTNGIYARTIYANRSKDLALLRSFSLLTVSLIELRDFITSRLDETIYLISKGSRFLLTSVLGQFIGLIWRGIIEGLKK